MTGIPDSTLTPGPPDLEEELDRFRAIQRLKNHWARPASGRSYYWYLTFFEAAPQLQSLALRCQQAIAFPYYDLTEPHRLHMTLDKIAPEHSIPARQLDDVEAAARRACQAIAPFQITFSVLGGTPGAIGFTASPTQPLQDLRDALRSATLSAYPAATVKAAAFHPHVAIAYANSDVPAAEAIQAVEKVNTTATPVAVTISEAKLVLLEQRERDYAWEAISRIPFTGRPRSSRP